MQKGQGGMGLHKHGVSGTGGQNRRGLQSLAREINRMTKKKKPSEKMSSSVRELMDQKKR